MSQPIYSELQFYSTSSRQLLLASNEMLIPTTPPVRYYHDVLLAMENVAELRSYLRHQSEKLYMNILRFTNSARNAFTRGKCEGAISAEMSRGGASIPPYNILRVRPWKLPLEQTTQVVIHNPPLPLPRPRFIRNTRRRHKSRATSGHSSFARAASSTTNAKP
jgi:hypothetical protein